MSTYRFKMGHGADAKILHEEADEVSFAVEVAKELAKLPLGLSMSMNFGPLVELPNGSIIAGLELQRWLDKVTKGWWREARGMLCNAVGTLVQIEVETNGRQIRNATCAAQGACRRYLRPADFEAGPCILVED